MQRIVVTIKLFPWRNAPSAPGPPHFHDHSQDTPQSVIFQTNDQSDAQSPLSDNKHSQELDSCAQGGSRTCNPSQRAAAAQSLRPRGHRNRHEIK